MITAFLIYVWAGFALGCWHLAYCIWEDIQFYHPWGSKYLFRHYNKWGPCYKNPFVYWVTLLIMFPVVNVVLLIAAWFLTWRAEQSARSI